MWLSVDGRTDIMNTLAGCVIRTCAGTGISMVFVPKENWRAKDKKFIRVG